MQRYQPNLIESKWQQRWREDKLFTPSLEAANRPYYALMMFPYPSAEGLHVGNMYPFTAVDIMARFKRMQGFDVFEPIGLDSFGIHSENYALKIGKNPMELTDITARRFYEQLKMIGSSYDWTKTLETHKPEYYKWTQWIFVKMYENGLAYQKEASVNWCPSCLTVLADEQVIAGKCERCVSEVEQKKLKQWFFRITEFADKLLDNLSPETWSERLRSLQKSWIGRSVGILINFEELKVFTTRPDTLFGVTFIAINIGHPMLSKFVTPENKEDVKKYISSVEKDLKQEKVEAIKSKTGVFTGSYIKNPLTGEKIPVWVADYVLASYGAGAVMGVPAHDQRDFEFAKKYDLEIKWVIDSKDGADRDHAYEDEGVMVNSGEYDGLTSEEAKQKISEYIVKNHLGQKQTNYHLRDWLISRQRYWGPPIPIIYCDKCGTVPVPEEDLPVILPPTENFRPLGTGKSPLALIEDFVNTTCPMCKGPARRETDVSDNFLDSAWYFFRYPSAGNKKVIFDPNITKKWLPVDIYIGGFEHALLHLMYTRFITMVFKKLGLIDFEEPFKKFVDNGHVISNGIKMSKSKGNVINPDEYIKEYGADTLRTYLMFMAPITDGGDFRKGAVDGIYRFFEKVWRITQTLEQKSASREEKVLLNKTIQAVTKDLETAVHFNTAISRLMEFLNYVSKVGSIDKESLKVFLRLLAPFAPHVTEELWAEIGEEYSIHKQSWPECDKSLLEEDEITIVITVNGKPRGEIKVEKNKINNQKELEENALSKERVKKSIEQKEIRKVIYIPGKILNFVV